MLEARFRPLADWPQADTKTRQAPRFTSTWGQTLSLLDAELGHLKAKDVVLETFHRRQDLRNDGWPKADARVPPHPGVIVSFASSFGPLRYLTDQFTSGSYWVASIGTHGHPGYVPSKTVPYPGWQANVRAIALSLEALRAVDRYGVSRRGEQYTGWNALPPGRPMGPAMTVEEAMGFLGIPRDQRIEEFSVEDIEANWKRQAKEAHPDLGGDPGVFRKITEAKDLLVSYLRGRS